MIIFLGVGISDDVPFAIYDLRLVEIPIILDTGSSALAVDAKKYSPSAGDQTTDLAQTDSYGDGSSWTGAVIQTTVTISDGDSQIPLPNEHSSQ